LTQWKGAEFQEGERLLDIGTNFFTWFTAAISSNGQWLAASTRTGAVTVWDLGRKTLPRQFNAHTGQVFVTGFLPGGNRLVTQDAVEFLREWNLITGEQTRSWNIGRPLLTAGGLSDDGHWFVEIGSSARRMALLDLVTGRQTVQSTDVKGVQGKVAFSPDGKHFAAPSELGHATTWETATIREVATIRGFLLGVHSVAFSPDGRRLAIGSGGKEAVKLWDVESHQELLTLEGRESMFAMTAFSPDGNALGSMNANGILHLWRAPSWEEIERQEKAAPARREP
jgi:hypothetical protein